ncbi:MAG: sigma-70 family RNA polymerase sigma factor [Bacteroidota bacterium]
MSNKKDLYPITDENAFRWWQALQKGEEQALHALYHMYRDDLFYYARRIVKGDELILNAIQDLFLRLWNSREKLGEARSVKAYLFSSLRRILLSEQKKQFKYSVPLNDDEENSSFADFSPEDIIILDEHTKLRSDLVAHLLNSLTSKQREIIYLKYYEELSIDEIATLLEINYQSVINHLQRSFLKLRKNTSPELLAASLLSISLLFVFIVNI